MSRLQAGNRYCRQTEHFCESTGRVIFAFDQSITSISPEPFGEDQKKSERKNPEEKADEKIDKRWRERITCHVFSSASTRA